VNKDPFKEYIKESEPAKRDKGYAWHTAIGLQAVDGLRTSEYLVHTAVRNIEGEISFDTAIGLLAVDGLRTSEYLVHTAVRNIEGEISFEEAN